MKPQLTEEQIDRLRLKIEQKQPISPRLLELSHYDINIAPQLATELIELQRGLQQPYYAQSNYASLKDDVKIEPQQFENSFAKAMLAMERRTAVSPKVVEQRKSPIKTDFEVAEVEPLNTAQYATREDNENILAVGNEKEVKESTFQQRIMAAKESLNKGTQQQANEPEFTDLESLALQSSAENTTGSSSIAQLNESNVFVSNYRKRDVSSIASSHADTIEALENRLKQLGIELTDIEQSKQALEQTIEQQKEEIVAVRAALDEEKAKNDDLETRLKEALAEHLEQEKQHFEVNEKMNTEKEEALNALESIREKYDELSKIAAEARIENSEEEQQAVRFEELAEQLEELKMQNIELSNENHVLQAKELPESDDLAAQLIEKDNIIALLEKQLENRERAASKQAALASNERLVATENELAEAQHNNAVLVARIETLESEVQQTASLLTEQHAQSYELQIAQRNRHIEELEKQLADQRCAMQGDRQDLINENEELSVAVEQLKLRIDNTTMEKQQLAEEFEHAQEELLELKRVKEYTTDAGINCTIVDSSFPDIVRREGEENERLKSLLQETTRQNSELLSELEIFSTKAQENEQLLEHKDAVIADLNTELLERREEAEEERMSQLIEPPLQTAINYIKQAVFEIQNAEIVSFSQDLQFLIEEIRSLVTANEGKAWTYLFEINLRNSLIRIPFGFTFRRIGNLRFKQFVSDDDTPGEEVFKLFLYVIVASSTQIGEEVKRFPTVYFANGDTWPGVD